MLVDILDSKVASLWLLRLENRGIVRNKKTCIEFHRPKMLGMVPLLYSRKNLHALLKNDLIPVALF